MVIFFRFRVSKHYDLVNQIVIICLPSSPILNAIMIRIFHISVKDFSIFRVERTKI